MSSQFVDFSLQRAADKFGAALTTPSRLLKLAPRTVGHPGNAAALNPAIVLTSISAFEGFAEDFLASVMALSGEGLPQIAKQVGGWNNPTLADLHQRVEPYVSAIGLTALRAGPTTKIKCHRINRNGNWSAGSRDWPDVVEDAKAWMQVRHLLTHGLATGWGVENWPPPLKTNAPLATAVLRPKSSGRHSLDRGGARSCARVYTLGACHIASTVAADLGLPLIWSVPVFD